MRHASQASEGGSSNLEKRSAGVSCVVRVGVLCAVLGDQVNSGFTLTAED